MNQEQRNFKKLLLLPALGLFGLVSAGSSCYPSPPCGWKDGNCVTYTSDGTCIKCAPWYFQKKETGLCTKVSAQCKAYCEKTGDCTACFPGWSLVDGECVTLTSTPPPCNNGGNSCHPVCPPKDKCD